MFRHLAIILLFSLPLCVSAEYEILLCDGCSDYSMRKTAEAFILPYERKVHVYNETAKKVLAWDIEYDIETRTNIIIPSPVDYLVAERKTAYEQVKEAFEPPTVPEHIAESAWDLSANSYIDNDIKQWLKQNASLAQEIAGMAVALNALMTGTTSNVFFTVYFKKGGSTKYKVIGFEFNENGLELVLELVESETIDELNNKVKFKKSEFGSTTRIGITNSGAFSNAAKRHGFNVVDIGWDFGGSRVGSFSCRQDGDTLVCTKVH